MRGKHAASGCHLPEEGTAVRRAVGRTGTSRSVPLVFGTLGAFEIVRLHKQGGMSWTVGADGVFMEKHPESGAGEMDPSEMR